MDSEVGEGGGRAGAVEGAIGEGGGRGVAVDDAVGEGRGRVGSVDDACETCSGMLVTYRSALVMGRGPGGNLGGESVLQGVSGSN